MANSALGGALPAANTALPSISRRSLVAGLAAVPLAVCAAPVVATIPDAADRYIEAFHAFNSNQITENQYMVALVACDDWEPDSPAGFVKKFYAMWFEEGNPAEDRVHMMIDQAKRLIGGAA